jgi:hypothetical protein
MAAPFWLRVCCEADYFLSVVAGGGGGAAATPLPPVGAGGREPVGPMYPPWTLPGAIGR